MLWYLAAAALITLVISVFAVQNSQPVTLKFLLWDLPPLPLVLIILFSAATGVLVTLLFSVARQLRLNLQIRDLQSKLKQLEKNPPPAPEKSSPGGNT
ncbi:MAG: LapA family protein [Actinobacteria bacterium]|nr:LapA family protein [Actinomycetota bacterium]